MLTEVLTQEGYAVLRAYSGTEALYLLAQKKPDLVFIEFSVNDSPVAYEETLANSETLLRKLWAANPYADAVYVHTTTQSISGCLSTGGEYVSRAAHSAVMHHYGVPQLDVGEMLRAKILLGGGDWMKYTTDTVHPNNDGYAIYANAVIAMLQKALTGDRETALAAKVLPSPMTALDRLDARLEDAGGVLADGWQVVESSLCGRYPHYLQATEPGAAFTLKFTGSRIGLYCMFAKDSGDITYSIDGGEEITRTMWDSYCQRFNRAYPLMLCDTLTPGEHKLRVRVSDTKNEQSEGHAIRIGAFMIY